MNPYVSSSTNGGGGGGGGSSGNVILSVDGQQVSNTVPADLITLIRTVMRTFYGFELYLCMEHLITYPCIKEEDLANLLRLDFKVVHQHLLNLKKEKFLNEKSIMETKDGKQSKHSCFFINYKMMVNVIKYKLDKIRIQIESDETQITTRPNFKCTNCKKTYSDLDTKDIFLTMKCIYCYADVEEDVSSIPTKSSRNLLTKFNTQMSILFDLIRKVEHIRLADHILRPEPKDMTLILESIENSNNGANANQINGANGANKQLNGKAALAKYDKWSGDKTRNVDMFAPTRISINFDSNDGSGQSGQRQNQRKELPSIILMNQTTDDDYVDHTSTNGLSSSSNRDSILINSIITAADETINNSKHLYNQKNGTSGQTDDFNDSFNKKFLTDTTNHAHNHSNLNNVNNNKQLNGINGTNGVGGQLNSGVNGVTNGSLNQAATGANLESIIMSKLLKHEKKATTPNQQQSVDIDAVLSSTPSSRKLNESSHHSTSSITITKKRPIDQSESVPDKLYLNGTNGSVTNTNGLTSQNDPLNKKRKLNNGDIVNGYGMNGHANFRRNHSEGSNSNSIDSLDSEENYGEYASTENDENYSVDQFMFDSINEAYQHSGNIPLVSVQNKFMPFDRVTPKLINMMNETEKETYIDICRRLYTEIYEI